MLFFDRIPTGSKKAEVTLRFINPEEGQDSLESLDAVFEVLLPCSEILIPEEALGTVHEDAVKFAVIRFFDESGLALREKTAVELG